MTPLATGLVEAGPHDKTPDPGVESVGIPKRRQVPPRSDEAVLDGVLGEVGIPQDQPGDAVEARKRRGREVGEGLAIATLRPDHQLALHVPLDRCAVGIAALPPRRSEPRDSLRF